VRLGYKLSSEEFAPVQLVEQAVRAEAAGFEFALISDHFHPWTDRQGQSPFVWSVIGAVARATKRLRVGTAVTCPIQRMHPALVAQAAATCALLLPKRFFLGLGTGENLNEHIVGRGWPSGDVRLEMLEEAVELLRLLWRGKTTSHYGRHFVVEDARIYSLPPEPPPLMIAASRPQATALAARLGDAMINTEVSPRLVERFEAAGGAGKPRYVEVTVCWARDERRARKTAREVWALAAAASPLMTELPLPSHFEAALASISEEQVAEKVVCGPDPARHLEALRKAMRAGYTDACIHQVGAEQEGFFEFYQREILPRVRDERRPPRAAAKSRRLAARA
jgi:G6PDH family F420-dependent oxidoreductase